MNGTVIVSKNTYQFKAENQKLSFVRIATTCRATGLQEPNPNLNPNRNPRLHPPSSGVWNVAAVPVVATELAAAPSNLALSFKPKCYKLTTV